jgi:hypothetical protein
MSNNNLLNKISNFEKLAISFLIDAAKKYKKEYPRKQLSLKEQIEHQIREAERLGDKDWADELKQRLSELI